MARPWSLPSERPWLDPFTALAISPAVFAFNVFGDLLRDALDPNLRLP